MKTYRTDIDGLRSLAILPVVLFHAGFSAFPGGFVGVDIFFVISGFLITSSLVDDMDAGRYSIAAFYERRIRRIFPAFIVMIATVALVGYLLQLPDDLKDLGTSIWATCLFVSNLTFWNEAGDYFGTKSEFQPLLHTWSLSVEEQFYIFFPIILYFAAKASRRHVPTILTLGFVGSLGLSVWATDHASVANFYWLPTRAWELLAGSLLAVGALGKPRSRMQAEAEGVIGLILLALPVFFYSARTPFPGITALPPVLGATLILHAGSGFSDTLTARLLSLRGPRFIGLISYSLYLWHWPLIVFSRYYLIELDLTARLLVVLAAIAMGTLSWHYVERPFRGRGAIFTRRPLFAATAALLAVASGAGVVYARDGLPGRVPADIVKMANKKTYQGPGRSCGGAFRRQVDAQKLCVRGAPATPPDMLVTGDSHAEAVAAAVFDAASQVRRAGIQLTDTGYRPVLGFRKIGEEDKYRYLNALLTQTLDHNPQIRQIVVPVYWHQAVGLDTYRDDAGTAVSGPEGMKRGLSSLFQHYPDRQFLLVLPAAHSLAFGGNAWARAKWYGHEPFTPTVDRASFDAEAREYDDVVKVLAQYPNVRTASFARLFCDRSLCRGSIDGHSLYYDDNHLSYFASKMLNDDLVRFFSGQMDAQSASPQRMTMR